MQTQRVRLARLVRVVPGAVVAVGSSMEKGIDAAEHFSGELVAE